MPESQMLPIYVILHTDLTSLKSDQVHLSLVLDYVCWTEVFITLFFFPLKTFKSTCGQQKAFQELTTVLICQ